MEAAQRIRLIRIIEKMEKNPAFGLSLIHIFADIGKWGSAGMTIEDGMFLACDANIKSKVVARKNLSSAVLGSEDLFNLSLHGNGVAALESNVPEDELIEVILENDELKIDGNLAV